MPWIPFGTMPPGAKLVPLENLLEIEMIHLLNMVMMVMEPIDEKLIPLLEIPKC